MSVSAAASVTCPRGGDEADYGNSSIRGMHAEGVREYGEGLTVLIEYDEAANREVVTAFNQAGYDSTSVDLLDLIEWIKINRPEVLR